MKKQRMMIGALVLQLALAVHAEANVQRKSEEGQLVAFTSSVLESAVYEEEAQVLIVTFRCGTSYEYYGVDGDAFRELLNADNKGKYFNAHIRNIYACERITN